MGVPQIKGMSENGREETVYPCPLCGRSVNRRGKPFDDPAKTVRHIDGSHDTRHADEDGMARMDEIRENGRQLSEVDDESHVRDRSEHSERETVTVMGEEKTAAEGVEFLASWVESDSDGQQELAHRIQILEDRVDTLERQNKELKGAIEQVAEALGTSIDEWYEFEGER